MELYKGSSKKSGNTTSRKALSTQNSQKTLSKNLKVTSNLKESFVSSNNEPHLTPIKEKIKGKLNLNPQLMLTDHDDSEIKSPKELASNTKKCIEELKDEAIFYVNSKEKKFKFSSYQQKKSGDTVDGPDTRETELKDSFNNKTPASSENYEEFISNAPKLSENDMSELKSKIEFLIDRMQKSEEEAKMHEVENIKLKEVIKNLEDKLDNIRLFHEPVNVNCSNRCGMF
ncbi:hypothetical protein SteCoe_17984 [Stentor coeruleus]|uniref:Uncharacterized protein n=1 Tax=Stentor coeruleus TaxID=5963 RepID=A0A1R2BY21_9CILI|nr:hypothetical protein SteCoe_17984 [Stentor coeruleus]